jgi:hypothetical protein
MSTPLYKISWQHQHAFVHATNQREGFSHEGTAGLDVDMCLPGELNATRLGSNGMHYSVPRDVASALFDVVPDSVTL